MTYSSAIFYKDNENLAKAQINKYFGIAKPLVLNENSTLLEIGCGWGGFSTFIAKNFGSKIKDESILDIAFNEQKDDLKDMFDMSFQDPQKLELIKPLLPNEIIINKKSLKTDYHFIPSSRDKFNLGSKRFSTPNLEKVMMIFTDITKEKSLQASVIEEEDNKEFILYVSVNKNIFIDTIVEIKKIMEDILSESKKEKKDKAVIERGFHTLKGIYAQTKMKKVSHLIDMSTEVCNIQVCREM